MHGGRAPQVQASAKARLLAGADLAIDYLLKLLEPKPPCQHCGRSDADRDPVVVRACQLVLDRSGYHPSLMIQQAPPEPNPYEHLSEDELIERLEASIARSQQTLDILRRQRAIDADDALVLTAPRDAVLIEDGFEVPEDDDGSPIQNDDVQIPLGNGTPEKGTTDEDGSK